jgi:hypothetical protein
MKRQQPVILSRSFLKLLSERSTESRVIRILYRSILRLSNGKIGYAKQRDAHYPEDHCYAYALQETGITARPGSRIINSTLIGDHFTFREKRGMISYMPRGKEQEFLDDGTWALKGRQATSPGKWMRSMFSEAAIKKLKIKDNEFADLATAVKLEELSASLSFREVSFEEAYDPNNYKAAPDSCMWGNDVGPFYRKFGAVAVVCVDGNDQFRARAVVWYNVKDQTNSETITLMDRIYFDSPEVLSAMCAYAASQGWCRKLNQGRGDNYIVSPDGSNESLNMRVKVESPAGSASVEFYPYLDTFQSGDYNSISNYDDGEYKYTQTGGEREEEDEHDGEIEDRDGNWWPEDEVVEIGRYYYHYEDRRVCYCHDDEYRLRENCVRVDGDWYAEDADEIVYSDPESRYILMEDAAHVGGSYYSSDSDKIVWSESEGESILRADAVEIRDQWYPKDDCVEIDGEWHLEKDCVEDNDGNWIVVRKRVPDHPDQIKLPLEEVSK